ncbi:hypothetical protein HDU96_009089 [Phlyctochytrium bullatum]|nr:hypothetical protein HDU96_009089 [Phlyctochytrium bullatum]
MPNDGGGNGASQSIPGSGTTPDSNATRKAIDDLVRQNATLEENKLDGDLNPTTDAQPNPATPPSPPSRRAATPDLFRKLADADRKIEALLRTLAPLQQKQRDNQLSPAEALTLAETEKNLEFTQMVRTLDRSLLKKNAESGFVGPADWIQPVVDAARQEVEELTQQHAALKPKTATSEDRTALLETEAMLGLARDNLAFFLDLQTAAAPRVPPVPPQQATADWAYHRDRLAEVHTELKMFLARNAQNDPASPNRANRLRFLVALRDRHRTKLRSEFALGLAGATEWIRAERGAARKEVEGLTRKHAELLDRFGSDQKVALVETEALLENAKDNQKFFRELHHEARRREKGENAGQAAPLPPPPSSFTGPLADPSDFDRLRLASAHDRITSLHKTLAHLNHHHRTSTLDPDQRATLTEIEALLASTFAVRDTHRAALRRAVEAALPWAMGPVARVVATGMEEARKEVAQLVGVRAVLEERRWEGKMGVGEAEVGVSIEMLVGHAKDNLRFFGKLQQRVVSRMGPAPVTGTIPTNPLPIPTTPQWQPAVPDTIPTAPLREQAVPGTIPITPLSEHAVPPLVDANPRGPGAFPRRPGDRFENPTEDSHKRQAEFRERMRRQQAEFDERLRNLSESFKAAKPSKRPAVPSIEELHRQQLADDHLEIKRLLKKQALLKAKNDTRSLLGEQADPTELTETERLIEAAKASRTDNREALRRDVEAGVCGDTEWILSEVKEAQHEVDGLVRHKVELRRKRILDISGQATLDEIELLRENAKDHRDYYRGLHRLALNCKINGMPPPPTALSAAPPADTKNPQQPVDGSNQQSKDRLQEQAAEIMRSVLERQTRVTPPTPPVAPSLGEIHRRKLSDDHQEMKRLLTKRARLKGKQKTQQLHPPEQSEMAETECLIATARTTTRQNREALQRDVEAGICKPTDWILSEVVAALQEVDELGRRRATIEEKKGWRLSEGDQVALMEIEALLENAKEYRDFCSVLHRLAAGSSGNGILPIPPVPPFPPPLPVFQLRTDFNSQDCDQQLTEEVMRKLSEHRAKPTPSKEPIIFPSLGDLYRQQLADQHEEIKRLLTKQASLKSKEGKKQPTPVEVAELTETERLLGVARDSREQTREALRRDVETGVFASTGWMIRETEASRQEIQVLLQKRSMLAEKQWKQVLGPEEKLTLDAIEPLLDHEMDNLNFYHELFRRAPSKNGPVSTPTEPVQNVQPGAATESSAFTNVESDLRHLRQCHEKVKDLLHKLAPLRQKMSTNLLTTSELSSLHVFQRTIQGGKRELDNCRKLVRALVAAGAHDASRINAELAAIRAEIDYLAPTHAWLEQKKKNQGLWIDEEVNLIATKMLLEHARDAEAFFAELLRPVWNDSAPPGIKVPPPSTTSTAYNTFPSYQWYNYHSYPEYNSSFPAYNYHWYPTTSSVQPNFTTPITYSLENAGREWVQCVTGVDLRFQTWDLCSIDQTVFPRSTFRTSLEEIAQVFDLSTAAGTRTVLNLFLTDVILRPEFAGALRICSGINLSVESGGVSSLRLEGKLQYAVRVLPASRSESRPQDVVVGVVDEGAAGRSLWLCAVHASAVYKTRVCERRPRKSVWGLVAGTDAWQFVSIDEAGRLSGSGRFPLNLCTYDEEEVMGLYRMVYHVVKCAYDAARWM